MARQMKDSGIEWIGEIPETWEISRIKYVSDFEPSCDTSHLDASSIITYTPMECIKNGWFINNTAPMGSVSSSLTPFENGDIVMAKVTPCFENGNIAIMENLASGYGLGSSELFVFRPIDIDTRYFFYWLQNPLFVQLACSTMTGTGGLKRVSPYFAKNCYIHHPPFAEQHRIAAFLDRKCAEIDAVIERTKATIEEYKNLKQAVITEAVTKGVRGPRKMKDSGVEWIGEIPEEWEVCKCKHISTFINGYAFDSNDLNIDFTYPVIRIGDIKSGFVDFEHCQGVKWNHNLENYRIKTNDILLAMSGATVGKVGLATPIIDSYINQRVGIIRSDCYKYLFYVLSTDCFIEYILLKASGSAQPNVSGTVCGNYPIPYPTCDEREEITIFLDEKCAALDTLIAKKTALLNELETYKKSLIYEYVTGKKEVG